MNRIFALAVFSVAVTTVKSQSLFIYAAEKIKGAEIPIVREEFEVTINDSIKKKMTSMNDGSLGRISLEKGTYKVKISHPEFGDGFQEKVVVNESKSTDCVITLQRLSQAQMEERKKAKQK